MHRAAGTAVDYATGAVLAILITVARATSRALRQEPKP